MICIIPLPRYYANKIFRINLVPAIINVALTYTAISTPVEYDIYLSLLVPQARRFDSLISWKMHFAIYVVYFSSRKTTPLSGRWKHPHKYRGRSNLSYSRTSLSATGCYKISTVYKFHFSQSSLAILRDKTELALGTKRVKIVHARS